VLDDQGGKVAESRHYPYGEERWRWPQEGTFPTEYRFTGQRIQSGLGLYFMGARRYDPALGRWLSADTLVPEPGSSQNFNRYMFVLGNSLRYTDASGHGVCSGEDYDPACKEDFPGLPEPPFDDPVLQWLYSVGLARPALYKMLALPVIWLAELGDEVHSFGPDDPCTQEVASDPAMDEFFEAWAEEGHPKEFSWAHEIDERSEETPLAERVLGGALAYARENGEMALAMIYPASLESRVDAVGGILGSYDIIKAMEVAPGIARIEVRNDMGWASFSRVPGTNYSIIANTTRSERGIGGTVTFVFYWYVTIP